MNRKDRTVKKPEISTVLRFGRLLVDIPNEYNVTFSHNGVTQRWSVNIWCKGKPSGGCQRDSFEDILKYGRSFVDQHVMRVADEDAGDECECDGTCAGDCGICASFDQGKFPDGCEQVSANGDPPEDDESCSMCCLRCDDWNDAVMAKMYDHLDALFKIAALAGMSCEITFFESMYTASMIGTEEGDDRVIDIRAPDLQTVFRTAFASLGAIERLTSDGIE